MSLTPCSARVGPDPEGHAHTCTRNIHPLTSAAHECPCEELWFDRDTVERVGALLEGPRG
jgi:hypothetical protein